MISNNLQAYAVCDRLQRLVPVDRIRARCDLSGAGGTVQYAGVEKGQLVMELIAAHAKAACPLALWLTDGLTYHRVILNDKHVAHWEDLGPREALHCMVADLKEVGDVQGLSRSLGACHVALSKNDTAGLAGHVCVSHAENLRL